MKKYIRIPRYQSIIKNSVARKSIADTYFDFKKEMHSIYFTSAREGFYAYLHQIKKTSQKKDVLLPGYICPSMIQVVEQAGLNIIFYDLKSQSLFPDYTDIAEKMTEETLLIVLAPYFGLWPQDNFSELFAKINCKLLLDLAQGLGTGCELTRFDAILFSFGIGKGVDYFGGELLIKTSQDQIEIRLAYNIQSWLMDKIVNIRSIFMKWSLANIFVYNLLNLVIQRTSEQKKQISKSLQPLSLRQATIDKIQKKTLQYLADLEIARQRASELYTIPEFKKYLFDKTLFSWENSSFLRFPLLTGSKSKREFLIKYFNAKGIELTRANEPQFSIENKNVTELNENILKLPFLASLSDKQYALLVNCIERINGEN
ncbi:MAG: DegT/DnrJ/EryC1/StrS family aminotransferase [Bdellovibrionales bacterium]|nr:DegT/DnrJ/EryC1/StrS family aminotransferase [Bdellovibrionales bacterium]